MGRFDVKALANKVDNLSIAIALAAAVWIASAVLHAGQAEPSVSQPAAAGS